MITLQQPVWNFEQEHGGDPGDETSVNLRAYFDRMPAGKMAEYRREWSDEQVRDWDDNFTDEGHLFLICSEREVDVAEYRLVLEQCIAYRARRS
ncbi:MAG: hypothetical protein ACRD44_11990 [Bryobacteraceae bacterium]